MIKNIEDLKKIQIVCRNKQDIENCLNILEELGFEVENSDNKYRVIYYSYYNSKFENGIRLECERNTYFFNKKFIKTLQKLIKEKEEIKDFEVAEDGRIIKVNNWDSDKDLYLLSRWDNTRVNFTNLNRQNIERFVNIGIVFVSKEARDKAQFKMKIEIKLKNIAERLNNGVKINWKNVDQKKFFIYYDYDGEILDCDFCLIFKVQGVIHCLDKKFLEVAKQEIGEENLIKYFKD